MEKVYISHSSKPRLILVFLGWGMDATPFAGLSKNGYDILAISNYSRYSPDTDLPDLINELSSYREIVVIAWSFGVRIATDLLNMASGLPITRTIAVNGTEKHIDDKFGIPQAIFDGTLQNLSPRSIWKFQRRMFVSSEAFASFQQMKPQRSFDSMLDELRTFASLQPAIHARWDYAIVGLSDAIFPSENQQNAWHGIPADLVDGMPHFPDMQQIINQYVIDKELVAEKFSNAVGTYGSNATPQKAAARKLWELTYPHLPSISDSPRVLEVGVGEGTLTELYLPSLRNSNITLWDIASLPSLKLPPSVNLECLDAETAIRTLPDESINIILSSSTLQWFNSPTEFIRETARVLRPGGIAAFSFFGPETYREISAATGRTLRYPTSCQLIEAATGKMELLVSEEETITMTFATVADALRHIKHTGVNAISRDAGGSKDSIRLLRRYPLAPDGAAPLTYHPLHIVFKKL